MGQTQRFSRWTQLWVTDVTLRSPTTSSLPVIPQPWKGAQGRAELKVRRVKLNLNK